MFATFGVILLFILVFFSPITHGEEIVVTDGRHPVCDRIKYASTDTSHYTKAYSSDYKRAANRAFIYALMASNVYEQYESSKPKFDIPGWQQADDKIKTWRGLGAHVYVNGSPATEVVVVFEGTNEGSWRDWIFGNLNIYWRGQYAEADKLIDRIQAKHPNAKIVTAGHSLGGGLAIHTALTHKNISVFPFNSSPRIFMPSNFNGQGSQITMISENEDILQSLREKWGTLSELKLDGPYHKFDFLNLVTNNNDKLTEHGMYIIARGLMLVAATDGNEKAKSIVENLGGSASACPK